MNGSHHDCAAFPVTTGIVSPGSAAATEQPHLDLPIRYEAFRVIRAAGDKLPTESSEI